MKYKDFQYRLLLGKIVTNLNLGEWCLKTEDTCSFCKKESESSIHLFFECEVIQPLIQLINEFRVITGAQNNLTFKCLLLNQMMENPMHIMNFISVFIKQYIYRCRCQSVKPNVQQVLIELKKLHDVEYYIAASDHKTQKHIVRWSPIFSYDEE